MNFRSWIGSAGVSFLESVSFLSVITADKSNTSDFWGLFSDEEFSTEPFWLTVFVDVDGNFTVVIVEVVLFLLRLLLIFFLWCIVRGWVSGVEKDSQVVFAVLSNQFNLGSSVVNVPTVIVEEVNILVDWWLVVALVFDFLIQLFLKWILNAGECENWLLRELDVFSKWRGKGFNHCLN